MKDENEFKFIGRLTKDPDIRSLPNGTMCMNFSIANSRDYTQNNNKIQVTNFFDIELMGLTAKSLEPYLKKGQQIYVKGEIKLDKWNDKKTNEPRSKIKFKADFVQMIGGKKENNTAKNVNDTFNNQTEIDPFKTDDDIPF